MEFQPHRKQCVNFLTGQFVNTVVGIVARLGAFMKLRKVTISFTMSVRPSVRPHRTRLPLQGFS